MISLAAALVERETASQMCISHSVSCTHSRRSELHKHHKILIARMSNLPGDSPQGRNPAWNPWNPACAAPFLAF